MVGAFFFLPALSAALPPPRAAAASVHPRFSGGSLALHTWREEEGYPDANHCISARKTQLTAAVSEAIDASLAELDATLPRGLRGIRLQELSLGPNPPVVRSVAAVDEQAPRACMHMCTPHVYGMCIACIHR